METIRRPKIGILFSFGKRWMGGVYYIINIIKSLDKLDDADKPELVVFYNDDSKPFVNEISYPYLELVYKKESSSYKTYLRSFIFRRNDFKEDMVESYSLDGVFPFNHFPVRGKDLNSSYAAWFPDLQHKFYPEYFSKLNWLFRDLRLKLILKNADKLVLSSNDVYNHLKQFHKLRKDLEIHILRFTSIMDGIEFPTIEDVRQKFGIHDDYFIVSNQFWGHKDHATVFRAISELKKNGLPCNVVLTGKMEDKRNPAFIEELKNLLKELDIDDSVNFVGLVDRGEQLCLMKNSLAVIQPSLFEGWSTVVEDAKALGCQIIASDLGVHLEQLNNGDKGFIFKAKDPSSLYEYMRMFITNKVIPKGVFKDYEQKIIEFAKAFMKVFQS